MASNIRKLSSGRYQVRFSFRGTAHRGTFRTIADARAWMDNELTELRKGTWVDPKGGETTLRDFSESWLGSLHLSERTFELYRQLLDSHILPTFGDKRLASITPVQVRAWHSGLPAKIVRREQKKPHPRQGVDGKVATAKAYRLLAGMMKAAVSDELILKSPCRLSGATQEPSRERGTVTATEAEKLALALPERLQAVVWLMFWCQLRQGEWLGLRTANVDLENGLLRISESRTKSAAGRMIDKGPKSAAGVRVIAIPPHVIPVVEVHLRHCKEHLVFPVHPGTWYKAWNAAKLTIGRPELRPHDLRHSGLTLLAQSGATTKELMYRAGHASPTAAMRYQHASLERDQMLAAKLAQTWHASSSNGSSKDVFPGVGGGT